MHDIQTLKQLNDRAADANARAALRRGSRPRSACCNAKTVLVVLGEPAGSRICGTCQKPV